MFMSSLYNAVLIMLIIVMSAFPLSGQPLESSDGYWRDDATGDWILGIFPEGIVYNGMFWTYSGKDETEGMLIVKNETGELVLAVGREKDDKISFRVGSDKAMPLSRIHGRFLPPYPSKEYRTDFIDSGYQWEDSVTISGWIRGLSDDIIDDRGNSIYVFHSALEAKKNVSTEMDSIGRFSIKFPVINSSSIYIDTKVKPLFLPVEPGGKYYILCDYKDNKTLVMGLDARIQNEVLAFDHNMRPPVNYIDSERYIEEIDNWIGSVNEYTDSIMSACPTISDLSVSFIRKNAIVSAAACLGQARFLSPAHTLSYEESEYARENFWKGLPHPLSLYPSYRTFIRDFVESELYNSDYTLLPKYGKGTLICNIPKEMVGDLKAETEILNEYIREGKLDFELEVPDSILSVYMNFSDKISQYIRSKGISEEDELDYIGQNGYLDILSYLNASPEVTDVFMLGFYTENMERNVAPLKGILRSSIDSVMTLPCIRELVFRENERYEEITARSLASDIKINCGEDFTEISEGKALFDKFIEPHRGRFVLIDVWGTWCAPCKDAMKGFTHEYAVLSPYGVDFLFFAYNSDENALKSIINEYNVSGEGVTHCNLPSKQQKALQKFLNVDCYPSYRLVDRDGNLIERNVDARDLQGLESILKELR